MSVNNIVTPFCFLVQAKEYISDRETFKAKAKAMTAQHAVGKKRAIGSLTVDENRPEAKKKKDA